MDTLPPGPKSALFAPYHYLRDPIGCLLPFRARYGPNFLLPGKQAMVVVGAPEAIKEVYTADPDALEPFDRSQSVFLGERSMILLGGAAHRRQRRLLTPPFLPSRVAAHGPRVLERTLARAEILSPGARFSALELAQRLTLDVILQAVFGVREPARMEALSLNLRQMLDAFSPLLFLFPALRHELGGIGPHATFLRRRAALFAAFDELIAEARATGPREDVLSLILAARDEDGSPLSDDEIHDLLFLLVVAGHETTAITLAWALYALHRPEGAGALERLRAELDAASPEPAALAALPYLTAVVQETLRRYPLAPAPAARRLLRPLEIGGHSLPAGMGVAVGIGIVHFEEAIYPDPWTFRPERFLERGYSPFEFVPFGGGARRCLGAPLAMLELTVALGALLGRWELRLADGAPERARVRGANVGPARGVPMIAAARRRA